MNTNGTNGLSSGLKALLLVVGALLALMIVLIWSFIIDRGRSFADSTSEPTQITEQTSAPAAEDGAQIALDEARNPVATLASTPECQDVDAVVNALTSFAQKADAAGGLNEQDRQLILDVLTRTDSQCDKPFSIALKDRFASTGIPASLSAISMDNDWVTPARPAPEDARALSSFYVPDRNMHCLFRPDQVDCSIYAYTFPSEPATCETYTQTFAVTETGETTGTCDYRIRGDELVEDGNYKSDAFACTVSNGASQVECWSELSGKGFKMSRSGSEKF